MSFAGHVRRRSGSDRGREPLGDDGCLLTTDCQATSVNRRGHQSQQKPTLELCALKAMPAEQAHRRCSAMSELEKKMICDIRVGGHVE